MPDACDPAIHQQHRGDPSCCPVHPSLKHFRQQRGFVMEKRYHVGIKPRQKLDTLSKRERLDLLDRCRQHPGLPPLDINSDKGITKLMEEDEPPEVSCPTSEQ